MLLVAMAGLVLSGPACEKDRRKAEKAVTIKIPPKVVQEVISSQPRPPLEPSPPAVALRLNRSGGVPRAPGAEMRWVFAVRLSDDATEVREVIVDREITRGLLKETSRRKIELRTGQYFGERMRFLPSLADSARPKQADADDEAPAPTGEAKPEAWVCHWLAGSSLERGPMGKPARIRAQLRWGETDRRPRSNDDAARLTLREAYALELDLEKQTGRWQWTDSMRSMKYLSKQLQTSGAGPVTEHFTPEQLRRWVRSVPGFLGLRVVEATAEQRLRFKLPDEPGVLVTEVAPEGPAGAAGLQPSDYLLAVHGQKVSSPEDFAAVETSLGPGEQVAVDFFRQGRRKTAGVIVAGRPAESSKPFADARTLEPFEEATKLENMRVVWPVHRGQDAELSAGHLMSKHCRVIQAIAAGPYEAKIGVGFGPFADDADSARYRAYRDELLEDYREVTGRSLGGKIWTGRERSADGKLTFQRWTFRRGDDNATLLVGLQDGRCVSYWFLGHKQMYPRFRREIGRAALRAGRVDGP